MPVCDRKQFGLGSFGSPQYVQRSVVMVGDDFEAYGIAALVEEFGEEALVYGIVDNPDSSRLMQGARVRIARIRRRRSKKKVLK